MGQRAGMCSASDEVGGELRYICFDLDCAIGRDDEQVERTIVM
jgi:hypothetical protein